MIEKIIFNVLAFTLFIFMFFKMIAKNDTTYLSLLAIQAIGIGINFIGLVFGIFTGFTFQVIIYVLAIVLPIIIFLGEKKGFSYSEMVYLLLAKIALAFHSGAQVKDILMKLIEKNPKSYQGHKMLAQWYQKQGAQRKAIEEYVQAIEINKKDYKSYFTIAVLLEDLTQQREAVTMLENLLERKPDYVRLVHPEIVAAMVDEHIIFLEAPLVQKQRNPLTCSEFPLRMLRIDPRLSAAQTRDRPLLDQFLDFFSLDAHFKFS